VGAYHYVGLRPKLEDERLRILTVTRFKAVGAERIEVRLPIESESSDASAVNFTLYNWRLYKFDRF